MQSAVRTSLRRAAIWLPVMMALALAPARAQLKVAPPDPATEAAETSGPSPESGQSLSGTPFDQPQQAADDVEEVIVQGKNPLRKSDEHLKELNDKLPCTGCDTKTGKIEAKRGLAERAASFVAKECCIPTRPPETNEAEKVEHQVTQEVTHPTNARP